MHTKFCHAMPEVVAKAKELLTQEQFTVSFYPKELLPLVTFYIYVQLPCLILKVCSSFLK